MLLTDLACAVLLFAGTLVIFTRRQGLLLAFFEGATLSRPTSRSIGKRTKPPTLELLRQALLAIPSSRTALSNAARALALPVA